MLNDNSSGHLFNRLRMRQVALLLAIEEHRTMRDAADAMAMSQPAASKMLQELEEALDLHLFERDKRKLVLNPAGELAVHSFRTIHSNLLGLQHKLRKLHAQSPNIAHLRLGHGDPDLAPLVLRAIAGAGQRPSHRFRLTCRYLGTDASLAALRDDQVDLFIGLELLGDAGSPAGEIALKYQPLGNATFSVLIPAQAPVLHEIGTHCTAVRWRALVDLPWVLPSKGTLGHVLLRHALNTQGVPLAPQRCEATTLHMAVQMAQSSKYLMIWPQYLLGTAFEPPPGWVLLPMEPASQLSWGLWCSAVAARRAVVKELTAALALPSDAWN